MRWSESIVVLLFVGALVAVYVSAAVIVVGAVRRRISHSHAPASPLRRAVRTAVLTLAIVGIACMAYGYFIEPYWLETTRVSISSEKLAAGARPIRIVQISDLHCDRKERLEGKLPEIVAGLEPDVIVFTGDAINSPAGLPAFKRCMKRLAAIAPTFAVAGNVDVVRHPTLDLYEGTGVRLLDIEAVEISVGGSRVRFAGGPAKRWAALEALLETLDKATFTVLLYHYPDAVTAAAKGPVDLYLAGHTHGGQVALPLYGALITFSRFGKDYEAGLYREKCMWLYVNRGIGMEGGPCPRVRFLARPEVTLIEVGPSPREATATTRPAGES